MYGHDVMTSKRDKQLLALSQSSKPVKLPKGSKPRFKLIIKKGKRILVPIK